ncbi:LppX_LprAFG lipoprotein [Kribbia dieselivorans]|uniref:LppX_LprAFG lipoprotein n=1 Tax=Kribbia dieselivorans TaxID=331526 RepID=UPI000837D06E|nr:LppX_LprAFG lipoprotein [Kribbia dieselivorans]
MRSLRPLAATAVVPALLFLGACSGSNATPEPTPAEALSKAEASFADAKSVSVDLTSTGVPDGVNGVTAATGEGVIDSAKPKFAGDITGRVLGQNATVPIIAIGDTTWMKLFSTQYKTIDLDTLGAPNPALLFHPTDGVSGLLSETADPQAGGEKREGSTVVRTYTGTVPASSVEHLLRLGQDATTFDVTYLVDTTTWQLRSAEVKGEFWKGTESTYTVKLSDYGKPVEITAP